MANILKMVKIQAVRGLLEQGWSYRRISRELGIHRETVGRYDRLFKDFGSKPAISTPGSSAEIMSKPAISTPGSIDVFSGRKSKCTPFHSVILEKLNQGLSAQRIFQDLVTDHEFRGSYSSVIRRVKRIKNNHPLPFRRMECEPGEEAQIDLGSGYWVVENGRKRRVHVFRIVLSHSRKCYSEGIYRQTTENFIRCLENAFWYFGGVPKTLVLDNLKAAVQKADWFDPELNPKIVSFARHYGCAVLPTKPYTPRHKGKIESGVKYVKNNALKGNHFTDLQELNSYLLRWERQVADTRIHGTTRKQVQFVFESVEKSALVTLPLTRFPFFHEGRRKVHRDGHVEVARSYYSVPPEYLGHELWIQWDSRLVRVYNQNLEQVTLHPRVLPGRFHTLKEHIADAKFCKVERGASFLLGRTALIGDDAHAWSKEMLSERGVEGIRPLQGFIGFTSKYPKEAINHACRIALSSRVFRLRSLRELVKRHYQNETQWLNNHPLIRPLSEYQTWITNFESQSQEGA